MCNCVTIKCTYIYFKNNLTAATWGMKDTFKWTRRFNKLKGCHTHVYIGGFLCCSIRRAMLKKWLNKFKFIDSKRIYFRIKWKTIPFRHLERLLLKVIVYFIRKNVHAEHKKFSFVMKINKKILFRVRRMTLIDFPKIIWTVPSIFKIKKVIFFFQTKKIKNCRYFSVNSYLT